MPLSAPSRWRAAPDRWRAAPRRWCWPCPSRVQRRGRRLGGHDHHDIGERRGQHDARLHRGGRRGGRVRHGRGAERRGAGRRRPRGRDRARALRRRVRSRPGQPHRVVVQDAHRAGADASRRQRLFDIDAPVADTSTGVPPTRHHPGAAGVEQLRPRRSLRQPRSRRTSASTSPPAPWRTAPPDLHHRRRRRGRRGAGHRFRYGGGQWQVTGAVAEAVRAVRGPSSSRHLRRPCGVESLGFNNHFTQPSALAAYASPFTYPGIDGDPPLSGATDNPNMEGGAYLHRPTTPSCCSCTSATDAATRPKSCRRGGRPHARRPGRRGVRRRRRRTATKTAYGLGWWVDEDDPRSIEDGAPTAPFRWLDLDDGYGVFLSSSGPTRTASDLADTIAPLVEEQLGSGSASAAR